jgi:hypothetical protein
MSEAIAFLQTMSPQEKSELLQHNVYLGTTEANVSQKRYGCRYQSSFLRLKRDEYGKYTAVVYVLGHENPAVPVLNSGKPEDGIGNDPRFTDVRGFDDVVNSLTAFLKYDAKVERTAPSVPVIMPSSTPTPPEAKPADTKPSTSPKAKRPKTPRKVPPPSNCVRG